MKKSERKQLKEKGIEGARQTMYGEDSIVVDFRFTDKNIRPDLENFSEKTVIDFVAKSYYKSCLTLLKRVNEYELSDQFRQMDDCAYRYLPAMYCFRHYLELKLKYLYMIYANESFNVSSHSLSALLSELKQKGFNDKVFDEPVAYIESLERIPNSQQQNGDFYFRYLIDRDIVCQESLDMPMFEFEKVRKYITDIEQATEFLCWNGKIRDAKSDKN